MITCPNTAGLLPSFYDNQIVGWRSGVYGRLSVFTMPGKSGWDYNQDEGWVFFFVGEEPLFYELELTDAILFVVEDVGKLDYIT